MYSCLWCVSCLWCEIAFGVCTGLRCVVAFGLLLRLVLNWLRVIFNYVHSTEVDQGGADEGNDGMDRVVTGTRINVVFLIIR